MSRLRLVLLVVLPSVAVLIVLAARVNRAQRQAEQARVQAEQMRVRAEQARTRAEQARVQAEQSRREAERAAYLSATRQALSALQDVQSLTRAGVTYQEYGRRIADTRVTVDRFLRECPADLMPPSRERIEQGMKCYEIASRRWEEKIRYAGDVGAGQLVAVNEKIMQDMWRLADEHIAAALAALPTSPAAAGSTLP